MRFQLLGESPLLRALSPRALRLGLGESGATASGIQPGHEAPRNVAISAPWKGEIIMVSRRTRTIRMGAIGVVGMGMAFLMAAGLQGRPPSNSPAAIVVASDESLELSSPAEQAPDMVIHEWGTFLGMSGSDGSSLDGMYHEEHALPRSFTRGAAINCGFLEA